MSAVLPFAAYVGLAAQIPYTPRPKEQGERGQAKKAATPAKRDMAEYMRAWRAGTIPGRAAKARRTR